MSTLLTNLSTRNKKRQHETDSDDDYGASRNNKKRKPIHEPRNTSTHDVICADTTKSYPQDHEPHADSRLELKPKTRSESLQQSSIVQQALERNDTFNGREEGVLDDDFHKGYTASNIPKVDNARNNVLSDSMGGTDLQTLQNNGRDSGSPELHPQNEEDRSTIQVLSRSINRKKPTEYFPSHNNVSCSPRIRYRPGMLARTTSRVSKTPPRSLLRKVLSTRLPSTSLHKCSFLEDEIEFVDMIGETMEEYQHARLFRIIARGQSFVLKIHKYKDDALSKPNSKAQAHLQYPVPNSRFGHESTAYARAARLQDLPLSPIPKCYGYVELTKIPQARSRHQRDPFRSTRYTSAAYLDFLIQGDDCSGRDNQQWRRYFRDKPPSACILRGIVLEDIPFCSLVGENLSQQTELMRSGREGLARLHECGVLHGDVSNLHHALVAKSTGLVVWVGLGTLIGRQSALRDFQKRAAIEVRTWESLFYKKRLRPRK